MEKKKKLSLRLIILFSLIILSLWNEGFLEDFTSQLQKYFLNVVLSVKNVCRNLKDFFEIYKDLQEEKEYWKRQTEELYKENIKLKILLESLKRRENFTWVKETKVENYPLIFAVVIGRDLTNWEGSFRIDKGKKDGIKENMPVLYRDQLIGIIEKVGNNYSEVKTVFDPSFSISGIIYETRDQGVIKGSIDYMQFSYLFSDSGIKEGFHVITSGFDEGIPYGLKIGYISEIRKEPSGILPIVKVMPFYSISKIEGVIVCKTY